MTQRILVSVIAILIFGTLFLTKKNKELSAIVNSSDSTKVYLKQSNKDMFAKAMLDSVLIHDLANLTTGHKHDEVLQIFKLNDRNVFYYKK